MKVSLVAVLYLTGLIAARQQSPGFALRVRQNNATSPATFSNASIDMNLGVNLQHADMGGEDCGDGPVRFDPDTWKKYDMDDTLKTFYENGLSAQGTGWDFGLEWAKKYGTDIQCRTTSELCEGSVGTCKDYPGSDGTDKSRGLLGLTAIKNAQRLFVEVWQGVEAAGDELIGKMNDFADIFLKEEDNDAVLSATFEGAFGMLAGLAGLLPGAGPAIGAVISAVGPAAKAAVFSGSEKDPLEHFSKGLDLWGTVQNGLKGSLDTAHSAFFSNGDAGDGVTRGYDQTLPGFLQQGAMLDPASFEGNFDTMKTAMTSLLSVKLIEAILKGQNAFMVYIDGIDLHDCQSWKKGYADYITYCPPEGMYFLVVVSDDGEVGTPQGWGRLKPDDQNWGNFGYTAQALMHSAAVAYQESGLAYQPNVYDYKTMIQRTEDGLDVFSEKGAFNMPICWIRNSDPAPNNWYQSDDMSKHEPPIDCRCRDDGRGNKFYDHPDVSPLLKEWLDLALEEHGGNYPNGW